MNKNEVYKDVNKLMKASNNFDVKQYEETLQEIETRIGKEVDRSDEDKMEQELAENVKDTLLKVLDSEPTLDMISMVEQIVTQAGGEYRALKTKYMNDAVSFFIDYLGIENTIDPPEEPEEDGKSGK